MKILLDTNIIIHREASFVIKDDIGVLFYWLDRLKYTKCVHPVTISEINTHKDERVTRTMNIKIKNYYELKTIAPIQPAIQNIIENSDTNINDINDSKILNELLAERVGLLITEDKGIRKKASKLGIIDRVFSIEEFLEKVNVENPEFVDYKVLSVRKKYFGEINIIDPFFDSFKEDYLGFEKWFNKKSEEIAYVCEKDEKNVAFLFLKPENEDENYDNIYPAFKPKKRLKIGTLKVTLNGYRIGERFLKIIFDNALRKKVDEIYVTIFDKRSDQKRLIDLLLNWGFEYHGVKTTESGEELVYTRTLRQVANKNNPRSTFPYLSRTANYHLVPIWPEYHTELLPDSILKSEKEADYIENEPFRNALNKAYISRSWDRDLHPGDGIIFYRTGGYYQGVVSTIGIVENVIDNVRTEDQFITLCRKRSVFTDDELKKWWNYNPRSRPFIVNFLYAYSFPRRPNLKELIDLGIIANINSAPRGFQRISLDHVMKIFKASKADESIIVD